MKDIKNVTVSGIHSNLHGSDTGCHWGHCVSVYHLCNCCGDQESVCPIQQLMYFVVSDGSD